MLILPALLTRLLLLPDRRGSQGIAASARVGSARLPTRHPQKSSDSSERSESMSQSSRHFLTTRRSGTLCSPGCSRYASGDRCPDLRAAAVSDTHIRRSSSAPRNCAAAFVRGSSTAGAATSAALLQAPRDVGSASDSDSSLQGSGGITLIPAGASLALASTPHRRGLHAAPTRRRGATQPDPR